MLYIMHNFCLNCRNNSGSSNSFSMNLRGGCDLVYIIMHCAQLSLLFYRMSTRRSGRKRKADSVNADVPTATAGHQDGLPLQAIREAVLGVLQETGVLDKQLPDNVSDADNVSDDNEIIMPALSDLGESETPHLGGELSAPLGANLPGKLKAKIVNNEFINFGDLLSDNVEQFTFALSGNDTTPTLSIKPKVSKSNLSISQWAQAFHIFVAVYCKRHPSEIANLMKYYDTIDQMACNNFLWRTYDEQFRKLRQFASISWEKVNQELYIKACIRPRNPGLNDTNTRKPQSFRGNLPKGYCWAFEKREKCDNTNCKFKHVCHNCGGKYAGRKCSKPASKN